MSKTARIGRLARSLMPSLPGIELFVIAIWRRSKTKPIGVLAHRHSNAPNPRSFPPEIVEMIIAHLQDDVPTLRACAATSFCWYSVAFPHLHHTLVLREWISKEHPYPLPSLSNLGLLSYVEKLNFNGTPARDRWVVPAIFNSGGMRYFRAMENLQELTIVDLDFTKFRVGLGEYLGHFAPTLRSVALTCPRGNRRQLLDFFRLFPKLDDIEISCYNAKGKRYKPLDPQVPITGGLRGRLTLKLFEEDSPGLLEDIIIAFGGMRFTSMNLWRTSGMQLLLETCADTLETLRICPEEIYSAHSDPHNFDLSSCTALRSLEISGPSLLYANQAFYTITSPVFSEVVVIFSGRETDSRSSDVGYRLRDLYRIREFSVRFCLEAFGSPAAIRDESQRKLTLETEEAVAKGLYDFLPSPPLIFTRTSRNHYARGSPT